MAKEDQPITLILTGSYTNFALWIRQYPDDISKIKQVVAMGGAVREEGNMTSSAEFNVLPIPMRLRSFMLQKYLLQWLAWTLL
ncbi:hypothetical protein Q757_00315 [Oenococcus alcoholitolerans]|uniref:Inosine/uridine-preferring nucleoside hydrolase domain-containing protein n=1 Tax=Oenococcus alcoholitolerans TaxID=931074 RepID=A0ABR4XST6_9LACO|nr:hypothetical protein Q757_00315 [Oenococcus alcoholitolerans]